MYYVYCIRNKANDKLYIGWTNDYERRWRSEIKTAFNPNQRDYNTLLSRAFRKYATSRKDVKNHFEFMVLEEFESKDESREAERFYIEFFRTNVSKFERNAGYNLTDGGEIGILGYKFTDEQRLKQSINGIDETYVFTDEQRIGRKKRLHIEGNKNNRKLTEDQINQIKKDYNLYKSYKKVAELYNVSAHTIKRYCEE